jgi:DNA-binding beta-propeller fold protein YncE
VTPISTATSTPGKPITVSNPASSPPGQIAITPNGKTAYVVITAIVGAGSIGVVPIQTATNTAGKPIPVGFFPFRIAITPDGKTAYATSFSGLTPINTATNTPGKPIKGLGGPIAITPDGTTVYAGSSDHTVTPVSTATNTPGKAITVGSYPVAIAITR